MMRPNKAQKEAFESMKTAVDYATNHPLASLRHECRKAINEDYADMAYIDAKIRLLEATVKDIKMYRQRISDEVTKQFNPTPESDDSGESDYLERFERGTVQSEDSHLPENRYYNSG